MEFTRRALRNVYVNDREDYFGRTKSHDWTESCTNGREPTVFAVWNRFYETLSTLKKSARDERRKSNVRLAVNCTRTRFFFSPYDCRTGSVSEQSRISIVVMQTAPYWFIREQLVFMPSRSPTGRLRRFNNAPLLRVWNQSVWNKLLLSLWFEKKSVPPYGLTMFSCLFSEQRVPRSAPIKTPSANFARSPNPRRLNRFQHMWFRFKYNTQYNTQTRS